MAKFTLEAPQESVREVEVFDVTLTTEEKSAFRASPEAFARQLLESEGYKVNRVIIDRVLYRDGTDGDETDDWPCPQSLKLVHAKIGHLVSHWVWICPNPM